MKHPEKLDIIDEQENIIDQISRDEVHTKGLLHREVHVWLYTLDNKIIFQIEKIIRQFIKSVFKKIK